ncbi:MAG: VCBS repeat-containing protein [Ruminococcaceae bacterium]|nr:VCBS repeat-containing protein [Oscillospiraceae bacterium]
MLKKMSVLLLVFLMSFFVCGCDFFTIDIAELLVPPALSDDLKEISGAIKESVKNTYTLKYPQSGEYHSAVVQKDVNHDGAQEAFAFYSIKENDIETMNINVVVNKDGKWKSVASQSIIASGVHRVDFCDLDDDGVAEILVGWQVYGTSEMQLAVYSFGNNQLNQRILKRYTHYITCNLDENKTNEILIIDSDAKIGQNTASLYGMSQQGVVLVGKCQLDGKVESIGHPVVAELSSGKQAVYIDSQKGIGAITEVLIFKNNKLLNPLFDDKAKETIATLRSASFVTKDINNDGVLEIPVQLNVPSVSKSEVAEKLYLTNWCSFNGEILTTQVTSMINVLDGYYYNIPASWVGNIAILKDTDNCIREIYSYNTEQMSVQKSLLYIRAISKKDWEDGIYDALNLVKIGETEKAVIACRISKDGREKGATLENIKSSYGIYEQE